MIDLLNALSFLMQLWNGTVIRFCLLRQNDRKCRLSFIVVDIVLSFQKRMNEWYYFSFVVCTGIISKREVLLLEKLQRIHRGLRFLSILTRCCRKCKNIIMKNIFYANINY